MCSYETIHEWQTRLTVVKPNTDNTARLELDIIVVDLVELSVGAVINHETIVTYDALSYTWGNALPSVECICAGTTILLRDNLASALRYLRQPEDRRYVWIDFLCINQQDNTEKSFQIPLMRRIYSGASLVIVWLGESRALEDVLRQCNEKCGLDTNLLICQNHKEESLRHVLECAWFERTWVRQEVYAAKRLDICSPYFSTSWENFTETMRPTATCSQRGLENQESLNKAYHTLRHFQEVKPPIRLLDLLKDGRGFQASVPHDHIFSILGMVPESKDVTGLIPVTYNKSYDEVCGDVTRFIIRETRNLGILRLCPLQRNRTYALDWPTIRWSSQVVQELHPEDIAYEKASYSFEWFDMENPIKENRSLILSEDLNSSSTPGQSVAGRPLVLYGNVWGVLSSLPDEENDSYAKLPMYEAKDPTDQHALSGIEPREDIQENYVFIIVKRGFMWSDYVPGSCTDVGDEAEIKVQWECRGCGREGDIFVSLNPGPSNVLLRRCPGLDELFEFVGWVDEEKPREVTNGPRDFKPVKHSKDWKPYHLGEIDERGYSTVYNNAPGPTRTFKIR